MCNKPETTTLLCPKNETGSRRRKRTAITVVTPSSTNKMSATAQQQAKTNPQQAAVDAARIKAIVWRDFTFLLLAGIGCHMMTYVELNASKAELRADGYVINIDAQDIPVTTNGVVDTGYILTTPLYNFLMENRQWNDALACLNSFALAIPGIYLSYVTFLRGDFDLAFRYMATHLLRSFCGWFTYLPPDPQYLPSNYDFPDIWQCLAIKDCSQAREPEALPFVSFFSGHVSTMVTTANHMYVHGFKKLGIFCHVMNILQMIRLLATRGHYSIDMIIAWYMAKYVGNTAGRLGRYYSKGVSWQQVMPTTATEAFETITGTGEEKMIRRVYRLMKKKDLQQALMGMEDEDDIQVQVESSSPTTATVAIEAIFGNSNVNGKDGGDNESNSVMSSTNDNKKSN